MVFGRDQTDQRFAHFCRTGDPDALGDVFDRTAGRLMRVALWLVRDRADAEDLLQRTFLQAIETRQQFRPGEPVLPWLMGLLGNQARKLHRERDRAVALRPQRDRVADPEVDAATGELEAAVRMVRDRLGEPYRQVLQLHLEQGLNAREIAERLDRPAGTVRTQLVRALDLLRKKLPKGFVAGLAAIGAIDASALAGVRTAVMATARDAAPALGASVAMTIGGAVMAKKTVLLLPAFVLLLGGIAVWASLPAPAVTSPTASQPIVAGKMADNGRDRQGDRPALPDTWANERSVVADQPADEVEPGFASLEVNVRWQHDGTPAKGMGVSLRPRSGFMMLSRRAVTDANGTAVLRHLVPDIWRLEGAFLQGVFRASATGPASTEEVELASGQHLAIRAIASQTTTASGQVIDREGRPAAGAHICVSASSNNSLCWEAARSDGEGRFTVPLRGYQYIGAQLEDHMPSHMRGLDAAGGPYRDLTLQLRGASGCIHGMVHDRRGAPVAGAHVRGVSSGGGVPSGVPGVILIEAHAEELETDRDGTFTASQVPPGPGQLWVWAQGFGPLPVTFTASAGTTTQLRLTLLDAAIVQGVARDAGGRPLAGAEVYFGESRSFPSATAVTSEDGAYRLGDLPAWPPGVELFAHTRKVAARTRLQLQPGATTEWNPVLDAGRSIRGTVLGPDGNPMPGLQVGVVHPNYQKPMSWHETDASGHFEVTSVGDQPRTVRVSQGEEITLAQVLCVAPDTADLVIKLGARDLPTARLRGRISAVQPLHGFAMLIREGTTRRFIAALEPDTGRFAFDRVPAARYRISAFAQEIGTLPLGTVELQPLDDRSLDDFVLRPPGGIELAVTDSAGEPMEMGLAIVRMLTGEQAAVGNVEHGKGSVTSLQPGRYFLQVESRWPHPEEIMSAEIDVASGVNTRAELRGTPSARITVRFRDPTPPDRDRSVAVWFRTDGGQLAAFFQTCLENPEPLSTGGSLAPGHYRAEGRASDGRRVAADFEVRGGEAGKHPPQQTITLDLPER